MKKELKRYSRTQCAFYKCRTKGQLEKLLLIKRGDLHSIKKYCNQYYSFKQPKKGTDKTRTICAPIPILKKLQRRIFDLLSPIEKPDWLISGQKGKSYIDNGKAHLGSEYCLTLDIKHFYDNCNREYVYKFFSVYLETSADVAKILTDIVTFNKGIPTGCPTSQLIAYFAYREMFQEVFELAQRFGCIFTLYVDDMTFSSSHEFSIRRLLFELNRILRRYGHEIKKEKTKYYGRNDFKLITGTVLSPEHKQLPPNRIQREVYYGFIDVIRYIGQELTPEQQKSIRSLKGKIQATRSIDRNKFSKIDSSIPRC